MVGLCGHFSITVNCTLVHNVWTIHYSTQVYIGGHFVDNTLNSAVLCLVLWFWALIQVVLDTLGLWRNGALSTDHSLEHVGCVYHEAKFSAFHIV